MRSDVVTIKLFIGHFVPNMQLALGLHGSGGGTQCVQSSRLTRTCARQVAATAAAAAAAARR